MNFDSLKRVFDPLKFRLGPDGLPRFDRLGRFVNLRGGRKKKMETNTLPPVMPPAESSPAPAVIVSEPSPLPPGLAPTVPAPAAPDFSDVRESLDRFGGAPAGDESGDFKTDLLKVAANPTAESVIGILQTALILLGGSEGKLDETEKELLRGPLTRVLKKYQVGADVMPAEVDLVLALLAVFASKLQKPKFAGRWESVKAWAVAKWRGQKLAKELQREAPGVIGEKGGAS